MKVHEMSNYCVRYSPRCPLTKNHVETQARLNCNFNSTLFRDVTVKSRERERQRGGNEEHLLNSIKQLETRNKKKVKIKRKQMFANLTVEILNR